MWMKHPSNVWYHCIFHVLKTILLKHLLLCVYRHGLRFVLSPTPTTASKLYLTKRFKWASLQEKAELNQVEVCPQAMTMAHEIAKRVGKDGGGALVIDYGEDKMISDSLQVRYELLLRYTFVSL